MSGTSPRCPTCEDVREVVVNTFQAGDQTAEERGPCPDCSVGAGLDELPDDLTHYMNATARLKARVTELEQERDRAERERDEADAESSRLEDDMLAIRDALGDDVPINADGIVKAVEGLLAERSRAGCRVKPGGKTND